MRRLQGWSWRHRSRPILPGTIRVLAAVTCVLNLLASGSALGAPACPDPLLLRQPDGTGFAAVRGGDERFNWISVEGKLVEKGPDGFWRYTIIDQGVRRASDARAGLDAAPSGAATVADAIAMRRAVPLAMRAPAAIHRASGTAPITAPQPSEPLLVLLVEFSDRTLSTQEADWAAAFFGSSGKTVRTYYQEASRGRFWFEPAREGYGKANDGIVRVRLNTAHPNTGSKIGEANQRIARDALVAANAYVDFAAFDTNGDGGISSSELHIVTVVAGYDGGSTPPSVWGHMGWLYDTVPGPDLDGVAVGDWYHGGSYVQVGELGEGRSTPIGPICHELGHDIGLPDLYDLDGSSYGAGTHCLMSTGTWGAAPGEKSGTTPVLLSAWCRIELGFVSPTIVTSRGVFTLVQACDTTSSNVLQISTSKPGEYFLVENRQPAGFDTGLSMAFQSTGDGCEGGGIAIWHVDDTIDSNDDEAHKHVDLEEANELAADGSQLDRKENWGSGRQYFYAGNATDFNDSTIPNSRLYNGTATGITIGDISASGASMEVTVGAPPNFIISGHVMASDGSGIGGVVLEGLPSNPVTDNNGFYTASAQPGWSGTVRPTIEGQAFDPSIRDYSSIAGSRTSEDYVSGTEGAGRGGATCPAAGFSPIILWTCLLAWLARPRSGRGKGIGYRV